LRNNILSEDKRKNNNKFSKNITKKEESFIDFNKYNGRKKYFKISLLSDSFGTPLATTLISSKQSNNISINETINSLSINLNTLRNSKINIYRQYLLADSGYDNIKNKIFLKKLGYIPIINYNKRKTKDKKLIFKNKLKGKELKIYKKRSIIESSFSWLKNYPVINQNYQKLLSSYKGLFIISIFNYNFKKNLK
jgi:hypothetical protein